MKVEFIESRKIIGMIDYPPLHSPETLATSYEYIKSGRHDLFIPIVVIPSNLVTTKKIKITGLGINMEETIAILEEHFSKNKKFWTVEEKTKAMIAQGDIPGHMF